MDHILRADGVGMLKSHRESLTWQLGSWLRIALQKIDGYEVGESAVLKKFDRSGSAYPFILEKLWINQSTESALVFFLGAPRESIFALAPGSEFSDLQDEKVRTGISAD